MKSCNIFRSQLVVKGDKFKIGAKRAIVTNRNGNEAWRRNLDRVNLMNERMNVRFEIVWMGEEWIERDEY